MNLPVIQIKISFLSLLADRFGKDEIIININNPITIKDLLTKLNLLFSNEFKEINMISENKLNKYIILGLNGRDIRQYNGIDTIIKNGDEISFLPAIAGG